MDGGGEESCPHIMTAALSTAKARLRCMISVGVGGASVRFWVCFLDAYVSLWEVVGLGLAFVLFEVSLFLLLGHVIATSDGNSVRLS